MPMTAKGVTKLIEECGELQQVLGKRLAYWATDEHPDGSNIRERMIEEIGDVMAAITLVADNFGISHECLTRCERKHALFLEWDALPDNNADGIDRANQSSPSLPTDRLGGGGDSHEPPGS